MKKIAIILLSILVAGMFIACNQDVTIDAQTYANMELGTFVLNGNNYATLQAAIDALSTPKAIGDNDGVIYLTKDASGPGAVIDGVAGVKIDFGPNTYSFTNVTATQGSTEGSFGLTVKGGAKVTLAGTKAMNLVDKTTGLTMVYVEGAGTSLAVEKAPEMSVADDQFVFWAANGATLTIGGETKVSGSIAATGTSTATPKVIVTESAAIAVPEMKTENAAVLLNTSGATEVAKVSATDTQVVVTGTGDVAVDSVGTSSGLTVQNLSGSSTVTLGEETLAEDKKTTIDGGVPSTPEKADENAAKNIIKDLPVFESGKGTKDEPYIIKTAAQLELFRDSVNFGGKTYAGEFIKLDSDISLTGVWTPIGNGTRTNDNTENPEFKGTFDGNGKTISNLTNSGYVPTNLRVKETGKEYVYGLFGVINGATITDLTLADVSISTYDSKSDVVGDCVGALVGYAVGETNISGCVVKSGSVQGFSAVGGLIGRLYGSNEEKTLTVSDCENNADVEGYEHVGGLIGWVDGSPRSDSAASTIVLTGCKNSGAVKYAGESSGVAGIAVFGLESKAWTLNVTDCVNYGTITRAYAGNVAYVICCDNGNDSWRTENLTYSFAGNSNSGSYSGPDLGRSIYVVSAMGVNGSNVWDYTSANYKEYNNVANKYDGGTGTVADPYQIASEATLKFFRDQVNDGEAYSDTYFILTDDITLTEAWTPIGTSVHPFTGTFVGAGKKIKNLEINNSTATKVGLFGTTQNVTISDLVFVDCDVVAQENAAIVIGEAKGTLTLNNISIDADSSVSAASKVGGLVAFVNNADAGGKNGLPGNVSMTNCSSAASLTATTKYKVGALIGNIYSWNSHSGYTTGHLYKFDNCSNTGTLSASTGMVGLIGYVGLGGLEGGPGAATYLEQEEFVFINCSNDLSKCLGDYRGYYIGEYDNGGCLIIEDSTVSYNKDMIGVIKDGYEFILKVNDNIYGMRLLRDSSPVFFPESVETTTLDLGQIIWQATNPTGFPYVDFYKSASEYTFLVDDPDRGKFYPISNTSITFDGYQAKICGGYICMHTDSVEACLTPFVANGYKTQLKGGSAYVYYKIVQDELK